MKRTIEMLMLHLKEANQITDWRAVNEAHLRAFGLYAVNQYRTPRDKQISPDTVRQWLSCVRQFFAWMSETG